MALLKNLLGNDGKDRENAEEMRSLLHEMQQERARHEKLIESVRAAVERMQQLGEPIAKAGNDVDAMTGRIGELQLRFDAMSHLSNHLQSLGERAEGLEQSRQQAEAQIAAALADVERMRSGFEDLGQKVTF